MNRRAGWEDTDVFEDERELERRDGWVEQLERGESLGLLLGHGQLRLAVVVERLASARRVVLFSRKVLRVPHRILLEAGPVLGRPQERDGKVVQLKQVVLQQVEHAGGRDDARLRGVGATGDVEPLEVLKLAKGGEERFAGRRRASGYIVTAVGQKEIGRAHV